MRRDDLTMLRQKSDFAIRLGVDHLDLFGLDDILQPKQIVRLIASGKSNKAIAKSLFLSVGTVKGYVSKVLGKLGVRDRTQAALLAVREGLVDPGADA